MLREAVPFSLDDAVFFTTTLAAAAEAFHIAVQQTFIVICRGHADLCVSPQLTGHVQDADTGSAVIADPVI